MTSRHSDALLLSASSLILDRRLRSRPQTATPGTLDPSETGLELVDLSLLIGDGLVLGPDLLSSAWIAAILTEAMSRGEVLSAWANPWALRRPPFPSTPSSGSRWAGTTTPNVAGDVDGPSIA